MKWLNVKLVISLCSLSMMAVLATAASASLLDKQSQQSLMHACAPALTLADKSSVSEQCAHYIDGYFAGVLAAKQEHKSEMLLNENEELESKFSSFEQRALLTRAGSYLARFDRTTIDQVCLLDNDQQVAHLNSLAKDLGYEGQKRLDFVEEMIEKVFRHNEVC